MKLKIKENIAYYLPQFHQIPENDKWWGEGFTEWNNLKSARKQYRNHEIYKPYNENYYNLDDVKIIEEQFKLAKENAISGFCFWHYWFGNGVKILEKPAEKLLESDYNVRFCFGWANHSWWNKKDNILLQEQKYLGLNDQEKHFDYLEPFFKDKRYIKINGKPVFLIFKIFDIPNAKEWINNFRSIAKDRGFDGVYLIGEFCKEKDILNYGLDSVLNSRDMLNNRSLYEKIRDRLIRDKFIKESIFSPRVYNYEKLSRGFNSTETEKNNVFPVIIPRWDSTIRHGENGWLLKNSTPRSFKCHIKNVKNILSKKKIDNRIVFLKSWNEWAEGNFIEPDNIYNDEYLKILKDNFEI
ncbi:TPA: glycosyltransferase WbsX family protein [Photobacterium damselae]